MALEHSACGTLANASSALYSSASKVLFFEVIEDKLRRRKVALTDLSRERQGMQCPASVQFYEGVHNEVGTTLRPDGNPEVVDLMHVVPWVVWRGGLRTMTRSFSSIPGTIHAKDPIAVCQREWDFSSFDTPCVVILEKLVVDGWSVGPPLSEHTLSSPRNFHTKDHLTSKPYLQCHAMLGNLFEKGLQRLVTSMPRQYYTLVMQWEQPQDVPLLADAAAYKKWQSQIDEPSEKCESSSSHEENKASRTCQC
jgi:hypothetical protein